MDDNIKIRLKSDANVHDSLTKLIKMIKDQSSTFEFVKIEYDHVLNGDIANDRDKIIETVHNLMFSFQMKLQKESSVKTDLFGDYAFDYGFADYIKHLGEIKVVHDWITFIDKEYLLAPNYERINSVLTEEEKAYSDASINTKFNYFDSSDSDKDYEQKVKLINEFLKRSDLNEVKGIYCDDDSENGFKEVLYRTSSNEYFIYIDCYEDAPNKANASLEQVTEKKALDWIYDHGLTVNLKDHFTIPTNIKLNLLKEEEETKVIQIKQSNIVENLKSIEKFKGEIHGEFTTLWVGTDIHNQLYITNNLILKKVDNKIKSDLELTKWEKITNERYSQISNELYSIGMQMLKPVTIKLTQEKKPQGMSYDGGMSFGM